MSKKRKEKGFALALFSFFNKKENKKRNEKWNKKEKENGNEMEKKNKKEWKIKKKKGKVFVLILFLNNSCNNTNKKYTYEKRYINSYDFRHYESSNLAFSRSTPFRVLLSRCGSCIIELQIN